MDTLEARLPSAEAFQTEAEIIAAADAAIAGGVVSINRKVDPKHVFKRAKGSKLWDINGREFIDFHAAFAPYILGHNCDAVNDAAIASIRSDWSLTGSGPTPWETHLADMLRHIIPSVDRVQLCNTGSEATAHAIRLSRAWTGRDDIILILGGYNGSHDVVARATQPPLDAVGPRVSPGEYAFPAASAGIPESTKDGVHLINFNDLSSLEHVLQTNDIACILLEPVMQNVGVVLPQEGYLAGVKALCRKYGAVCVFDEVKTGFRSALGGYQSVCEVTPDLSVFGKAIANGYPMAVIGGRADIIDQFDHPAPEKRVLIAGTYNAHPINCAAAIATIEFMVREDVFNVLEQRGAAFHAELNTIFNDAGVPARTVRNASAFCTYFMDHDPVDWHDILQHHNFELDRNYRLNLLNNGIYQLPVPAKQGSISYAHSAEDMEKTLEATRRVVRSL
ncbi:MAG: aminotransferase class III-fold pyridoxal phosphate-dependent enzyme [Pseudomonadota bacterium]